MTASEREGAAHRRPRRKRRHPRRWLIALPVLAVGGWLWLQWQCWGLQTCRALAQLPGLPQGFDGFTIVHLSDLHGHEYGAGSRELLERVRAERPDLIVVTGDLIDQKSQLEMVPPWQGAWRPSRRPTTSPATTSGPWARGRCGS